MRFIWKLSKNTLFQPNMSNKSSELNNNLVVFLGEFIGTFLFLFMAYAGTQVALTTSSGKLDTTVDIFVVQSLYISLIFGFSLAVNVWVFFRISGGLFNPAVTLALCISGVVPLFQSMVIFIAEMAGSIAAAAVVRGLLPGNEVYFTTQLGLGTSIVQGVFLEMFMTAQLIVTILMIAAEKTKSTFIAPVGIGLSLFVDMLVGTPFTGCSVNPARSFAPAVVGGKFPGYHWIYWVGPLLGALLASAFYKLMKLLRYEDVRGDQELSQLDMEMEGRTLQNAHGRSPNGKQEHHSKRSSRMNQV